MLESEKGLSNELCGWVIFLFVLLGVQPLNAIIQTKEIENDELVDHYPLIKSAHFVQNPN